jgi:protein TonB
VLGLDAATYGPVRWVGYSLGAITLMFAVTTSAAAIERVLRASAGGRSPLSISQEIEVFKEEPPPPPPPAPEPETKQEPPHAPVVQRAAPPPAPAEAAKVLTREPDPNEPIDLTGNTIVTGNADAYVGGVTATNGTSKTAVYGATSPSGAPAAHTAPPAPPGPDRSRVASVGSTEWNAPFPPEADALQIDEAYVTLQVNVRADGTAGEVRIIKDPGNGFGRTARSYALGQHFAVALDHDGQPIVGWTKPFAVHFSR